jgi:predicted lipoprotein with Yx(FWY)xxD motif
MKRSLPVLLATLALVAGACGDDDDSSDDTTADTPVATDAPAATEAPAATDAPAGTDAPAATDAPAGTDAPAATEPEDSGGSGEGEELALATTDLGEVIVDDEGLTMYLFMPDAQGDTSVCNDDCAAAWPPQVEIAEVGEGLDASLVGTITRDDGTVQGTYNGWPLYYFSGDSAPGDVNGQALNDVWWVMDASGNAIGV